MSIEKKVLARIQNIRAEESHLFRNFEKYYEKKNFAKASEFLWGSVAKISFAIGLLFGKRVGKHRENIELMRELAKGDITIIENINSAEALHSNFYHNWMEEAVFKSQAKKVVDLRIWLIQLLDQEIEKALKR